MPETNTNDKFHIRRRSSSHSAYWMCNALIPAGLLMIYRFGWSLEGVLGILFFGLGALGYGIYKQKMSVPLLRHDGSLLIYSPSDRPACSVVMDSNARFTVHELGMTIEIIGEADSKFELSRLDFNSNEDWHVFLQHLKQGPVVLRQSAI